MTCSNQVSEIKEIEANLHKLKRQGPNQFGHIHPYYKVKFYCQFFVLVHPFYTLFSSFYILYVS